MSTTQEQPLDVVGVGLGPFNLGLAALLDPVPGLRARFYDARDAFSWHPGLLLEDAEIQVPFLADLVTLADPTSRHSFLNYLHQHGRLYRFYFRERFHLLRREFQAYCRWVAEQLESCRFGHRVVDVAEAADGLWEVHVRGPQGIEVVRARQVVLGVGMSPIVPECAARHLARPGDVGRVDQPDAAGWASARPAAADGSVLHSAAYLDHRERLLAAPSVVVVGSGQSAAEVFLDLLQHGAAARGPAAGGPALEWLTRSRGFLAMEYSKLGLEHFTPEYVDHFHALDESRRDELRAQQDLLYKGISAETSARIFDLLYERGVDGDDPPVAYRARTELRGLERDGDGWRLTVQHLDQERAGERRAAAVVLATGYGAAPLPLAADLVARDGRGRPQVERDYRLRRADGAPSRLFVQNAELHAHGVGTPDLGLAAHRNATIVNAIAGRDVYAVRSRNVFQSFGLDDGDPADAAAATPLAAPAADRAPRG
ncbi:lysine N(6)-hydroxylase/L-ornithine N(5)-oxygenase family protein [Patulibacter defluvii]|uniref:lysine N(6)-hydroxylase/L-ornithine N(5)-oxygenase family protein n=1 Tax=Patulibacter defluvii TaxID=3095358 RepID=UPI002A755B5D|nr:SidA/IucD/PvdA family monooxygenase [Patulibacter sp. DM4]